MTKKALKKDLLLTNNIKMWDENKIKRFRQTLLDWYDNNKRDLPWRQTSDPYYIWVSEIMLQQTQVETVIPYYNRFISTLPTVKDLAEAPEDTLLKLWEGLGYYSRVRNMKVAANQIIKDFNGVFPKDIKDIISLKGIGPYTAGAVSSIAFKQAEPAVDGNVMRVMSRLFELDLDIGKASSRPVFEAMIRKLIDPDRPGDFNQALMDLGATVCTPKNYKPESSPVKEFNASFLNETWMNYPVKKSKKKVREEEYIVLALSNENGEYLFERRGVKGVLAGMWTFIMISKSDLGDGTWKDFSTKTDGLSLSELTEVTSLIKKEYGLTIDLSNEMKGTYTHIFSHLKWHLTIYQGNIIDESSAGRETEFIHPNAFSKTAFPVPTQKVWELINSITLF